MPSRAEGRHRGGRAHKYSHLQKWRPTKKAMAPGGQRRRRRRTNVIKKETKTKARQSKAKQWRSEGKEKCKVEADGKTEEPRLAAES